MLNNLKINLFDKEKDFAIENLFSDFFMVIEPENRQILKQASIAVNESPESLHSAGNEVFLG